MALVLETERFEAVREVAWASLVRVKLEFNRDRAVDADLTLHILKPMAVSSADSTCTEKEHPGIGTQLGCRQAGLAPTPLS